LYGFLSGQAILRTPRNLPAPHLPFTPVLTTRMITYLIIDKSTSLMSMSHLYRGYADRSASVEPAWRLQHTKWILCIITGNVCTV